MSNARLPGILRSVGRWIAARTPGPLGFRDQADPLMATLLGDSPGPLGFRDWGDPVLPLPKWGGGSVVRDETGTPMTVLPDGLVAKEEKTIALKAAPADWRLGNLSMKYETGQSPGNFAVAAATVSTGQQDKGGISYGAYQLASSAEAGGVVQKFLLWEGKKWATSFKDLDPTKAGAFGDKWKEIAAASPVEFFDAQHTFIERTHYKPVVDHLVAKTGVDVRLLHAAVQDAVWSASVQHGGAKRFLTKAVELADVRLSRTNGRYAVALVNAMYEKRIEYVNGLDIPNKETLLENRYPDERRRALEMMGETPNDTAAK